VAPLAGRSGLAVQYAEGPLRPFLLLPGFRTGPDDDASAGGWRDIAIRLNQVGHAVATLDLPTPPAGAPDLDTAADDVAHLIDVLDLRGRRAPIATGHGLGGNLALSLAARRGGVSAVACIDGGWTRPVEGPDPRAWYPLLRMPSLLCATLPAEGEPDPTGRGIATRAALARAVDRLPVGSTRVSWYPGAAPDIRQTEPARLTEDLLALADRAEPGPADPLPVHPEPGRAPGYLPLARRSEISLK
jgi:hypothetical protein